MLQGVNLTRPKQQANRQISGGSTAAPRSHLSIITESLQRLPQWRSLHALHGGGRVSPRSLALLPRNGGGDPQFYKQLPQQ